MEKKKRKYRDIESMTDEEFKALTREIAGPRVEFYEPKYYPRYTERHDNPMSVEVTIQLPFTMMRIIFLALARWHITLISLSIQLMVRESMSIME